MVVDSGNKDQVVAIRGHYTKLNDFIGGGRVTHPRKRLRGGKEELLLHELSKAEFNYLLYRTRGVGFFYVRRPDRNCPLGLARSSLNNTIPTCEPGVTWRTWGYINIVYSWPGNPAPEI